MTGPGYFIRRAPPPPRPPKCPNHPTVEMREAAPCLWMCDEPRCMVKLNGRTYGKAADFKRGRM